LVTLERLEKMVRKLGTSQAWQFAKALAKGQPDRWELVKTIVENRIREVV
jgi:pyruvate dehydrogenase (quinone)